MTELAKSLAKLICVVTVKTGEDGKMFGTVTAGMIADQLKTPVRRHARQAEDSPRTPDPRAGRTRSRTAAAREVNATLKVKVESITPLPVPALAPATEGRREDRMDRRGRRSEGHGPAAEAALADKAGTAERRPRAPRPDRPPRTEKAEKPEKPEKSEKPEKPAKAEKAPKAEKPAPPAKAEKAE